MKWEGVGKRREMEGDGGEMEEMICGGQMKVQPHARIPSHS